MTTSKELLDSASGGAPGAQFPSIGTTVGGLITKVPKVSQQTDMQTKEPQFWDDGNPKMQIEVTVQTSEREDAEDDGQRRIYVKGLMLSAVRDAVAAVGQDDVERGGTLLVTYVGDRPSKTRGFSPAKVFEAQYTGPSGNGVAAPAPDEEPF